MVAITGVDKTMAAQAYFAMDKNEELALNYLLDHGMEDEDDAVNRAVANSMG